MKIKLRILLVLTGGLAVCFSFPKWNLCFLAWVGLVPLFAATDGLSFPEAFFLGWVSGLAAFCGMLYWIVPTFKAAGVSAWIGVLSTLFLSGYLALYTGLFCGIREKFFKFRPDFLQLTSAAALWTFLEFARGSLFTGFPWGTLGYSQWKIFPLIQISEWTGVYGVSALIVAVNLFLYRWIKSKRADLFSLSLIAAVFFLNGGIYRLRIPKGRNETLKVAILQGNIDQYKKWNSEYVREITESYRSLCERVKSDNSIPPDLVVWPETSAPGWVPEEKWLLDWLQKTAKESGSFNLVGAVTKDEGKSYNSAFLFSPDGKILGRYDKMHLVPFGEFVPLQPLLSRWIAVLNDLGGFDGGRTLRLLEMPRAKLGVSICYEAIFPGLVRAEAAQGAGILVNITNDGWYLDTAAPEQHFSMNVFRAVENRRFVVRSANTGISGLIAPTGEVIQRTNLNERTVLEGSFRPAEARTFYTRHGDAFAWLCGLASLAGIISAIKKKRSGYDENT